MILLKDLLVLTCLGALVAAVGTVAYDIYLAYELSRILHRGSK